jgi:hypothetical protein
MRPGARFVFLVVATAATSATDVRADPRFGPNDLPSLFEIGKNIDRNVVRYGIHLDKDCVPIGEEPLYAYWRQFEKGPGVNEDLNFLDKTVYGIKGQWIVKRSVDGSKVLMTLRSTDRPIAVIVNKNEDGKCVAQTIAKINGEQAHLDRVFVHVPGFMRVDWIEIRGITVATGKVIVERVNR